MRPLECPVCMIRTAAKMAATMACVSSVIKSPPGPPTRPDLYRIGDREYRDQVHRDYVCWSEKQRNVDRRSICACRFKPSSLGFTVSGVVEALLNSPVSGERPPPRCWRCGSEAAWIKADVLTRQTGASAVNVLAAGFWRGLDVTEKRLQPARELRAGAHVGAAEPDTSRLRALRTAFGFRIIELSVFLTVWEYVSGDNTRCCFSSLERRRLRLTAICGVGVFYKVKSLLTRR
jgi:hypothetical protein